MFEKIINDDNNQLLNFLSQDAAFNTFLIGDYYNFSLNSEEVEFFAWKESNVIKAVIMRFRSFLLLSNPFDCPLKVTEEFLLSTFKSINRFNATTEVLSQFSFIKKIKAMNLVSVSKSTLTTKRDCFSQLLSVKDAEQIVKLEREITEFTQREDSVEEQTKELERDLEKGDTVVFGIKEEGRVVSVATLSAINPVSGMIVGVCTTKESRKKGYAYDVLSNLLNYAFETLHLKTVSLFWDNEIAGIMYAKVGFKRAGNCAIGEK